MSCLIGACHAHYNIPPGTYTHNMGIVEGGKCACLASAGPMGLGLIDYLVHGPRRPGLIVVTDIDDARLERAKAILTPEDAKAHGIAGTSNQDPGAVDKLMDFRRHRYDVFVWRQRAVAKGDAILGGTAAWFLPADNQFTPG